jgi:hypothetical protein
MLAAVVTPALPGSLEALGGAGTRRRTRVAAMCVERRPAARCAVARIPRLAPRVWRRA